VSDLDVLRIRRAIADARGRIDEARSRYRAERRRVWRGLRPSWGTQSAALLGREDSFKRTVLAPRPSAGW